MNEENETLVNLIKNETGYSDVTIEHVNILYDVKNVTAKCEIEPGIKKSCSFILHKDKIFYAD